MAERALTLTPETAEYLMALRVDAERAMQLFDVAFTTAVRAHGVTACRFVRLETGSVVIEVPE